MASDEMRLILPVVSTVTYLTDVGGPTLIMNQTTFDGNGNRPVVAETGALFFPEVRVGGVLLGLSFDGYGSNGGCASILTIDCV